MSSTFKTNTQDITVNNELKVDTDTLFVDAANNSIGMGTLTPTAAHRLDVRGKSIYSDILGLPKIATGSLPTASSYEGYIVYDDTTNTFKYSNGTSWVDPSSASVSIGTTVTSGTTGSILFVGSGPVLAQDNANFFWDDTNNRLGIRTASPSYALDATSNAADFTARIASTDTTGNGGCLLIDNPDSASGHPFITFRKNAVARGGIQGYDTTAFGMMDGINLSASSGKNVNFRIGSTSVGNFDSGGSFFVDTNSLVVDATNNRVGVVTTSPSEALHVTGNVRFSGALMPNNSAGTAGQVLQSAGAGSPPTWVSGGTTVAIGGTVTSGTTGSILFVGSGPVLAQDNANFFWDDTNNRLGVGTASPSYRFDTTSAAADFTARIASTDTTGSGGCLLIDNAHSGSGHPFITFRKNAVNRGGIQGYDTTAFGMRDGINLAAASGKDVNFRIGSTSVGYFNSSGHLILPTTTGNVLQIDTNAFIVDATNNRIGVNVTSPTVTAHIQGGTGAGDGSRSNLLILQSTSYTSGAEAQMQFAVGVSPNGAGLGAAIAAVDVGSFDTRLDFRTRNNSAHSTSTLTTSDTRLSIGTDGDVSITPGTVTTAANNFVSALSVAGSYTKNDANTRQFYVERISPTFNFGGSNNNTTVNILDVDSTNTSTTGLTCNLIRAAFGGTQQFLVNSAGDLSNNGATTFKTSSVTGTTTAGSQRHVFADATSGAFTVNLPTAVGITGREYIIHKTDASGNAVTVDGNGSETIDGATTQAISTQYGVLRIVSNGTNWLSW